MSTKPEMQLLVAVATVVVVLGALFVDLALRDPDEPPRRAVFAGRAASACSRLLPPRPELTFTSYRPHQVEGCV